MNIALPTLTALLLIAYLLGVATPIFLMRGLAIDDSDSCFLNLLLASVVVATLILVILILRR